MKDLSRMGASHLRQILRLYLRMTERNMKNALPIVIVVVVILGILGGGFWFLRGTTKAPTQDGGETVDDSPLKVLSVEESPYVTLTPSADGHNFHLTITKVPTGTGSLEYEMVYAVSSGVTQGVPGTIKDLSTGTIERDLLLGTCSSGKCRYDEGVNDGTFTVRLRDSKGHLVSKMETQFHLQKGEKALSSADGKFTYTLSKASVGMFYITMGTFGIPSNAPAKVATGPYGVFSKDTKGTGTVSLGSGDIYQQDGSKWTKLTGGKASGLGVFAQTASQ